MDKQDLLLPAQTLEPLPAGRAHGIGSEILESLTEGVVAHLVPALVPALAEQLIQNIELRGAIGKPPDQEPLPRGVRPEIALIMAALHSETLADLMSYANRVVLRDLREVEVAFVEGVSLKTVQRWRTQGNGPPYRCQAGISYPVSWLWKWRVRGKQRITSERKTRGR